MAARFLYELGRSLRGEGEIAICSWLGASYRIEPWVLLMRSDLCCYLIDEHFKILDVWVRLHGEIFVIILRPYLIKEPVIEHSVLLQLRVTSLSFQYLQIPDVKKYIICTYQSRTTSALYLVTAPSLYGRLQ